MIVVNKAEIERRMAELGLRRIDLTRRFGISQSGYNSLMSGNRNSGLRIVLKFCEALQCQPSDILMKVKND